ncbi:MAG: ABC transporter permease [Candidatus Krumholzibacteria bacterium]|nr:ABC transporter permease [Candidatus Krumholzibacteria bacterium]
MGSSIIKRLALAVPLVVLVSIVTFALLHLAPGGPAGIVSGNPKTTGEDMARIRENYGLDRPLPVQYVMWFRQVFLRLDFGRSYVTGRPVTAMIAERVPATLELMGAALILAVAAGGLLAVLSAIRGGDRTDGLFTVVTTAGISVPVFWLGLIAIYLFSIRLGLLPAGGRAAGDGVSLIDRLRHIILPASVLSIAWLATWSRYLRSGLIDSLSGKFIRTARAKGLTERTVVLKHAMRGAVLPAVTVLAMQIPALFTGAVITETVFAWPGMGRLFYEGLQRQDYTRVLGIVVIASILIILMNTAGDLINMILDPRTRPAEEATNGRGGEVR